MAEASSLHPDADILRLFLLGQLDTPRRDQVERHLENCDICCRTSMTVEDDRLVQLLRRREAGRTHGTI